MTTGSSVRARSASRPVGVGRSAPSTVLSVVSVGPATLTAGTDNSASGVRRAAWRLSVRVLNVAAMGVTGANQLSFAELERPRVVARNVAARDHFRRGRPGNHRRTSDGAPTERPPTRSPRSARSRSAAASCSASSPPWWTRSAASRRRSCSSPASPRRWCATPRPSTRCCRCSWSSPAIRCWSPTTPGSTSDSCGPPRERCEHRLAAAAGAVHGPAGPPGAQPRGSPQRAAGRAGAAVRRRHPAHPPRPRRRPRHRRRVARAHRASRQPGRAHLRRPARLPAERDAGPAPQTGARRGLAAPAGRLSVPRAVGRGALRRHRDRPAAPGQPVLQRRRSRAAG